jgi:predicted nucleotidyltransferase
VHEVWIFGSYARGALEVGDVDLAVEFDQTKDEAGRWFATLLAGGFDHLRRAQARAPREPAFFSRRADSSSTSTAG